MSFGFRVRVNNKSYNISTVCICWIFKRTAGIQGSTLERTWTRCAGRVKFVVFYHECFEFGTEWDICCVKAATARFRCVTDDLSKTKWKSVDARREKYVINTMYCNGEVGKQVRWNFPFTDHIADTVDTLRQVKMILHNKVFAGPFGSL